MYFTVYKTFCKNILFLFINENYKDFRWRKTTCTFSYVKKSKTLLSIFIYKNPDTLQKARQFALRFFICKKPDTLRHASFSWNFWNFWRGRGIFNNKKNALSLTFLCTKSQTLSVTFLYAKTVHFLLRSYIYNLSYSLYWYLIINTRTIRAIKSINKFEVFIENLSYSCDK